MIFHAYLTAYFFWLALAVGSLTILMLHNLAGGYWGAVMRRPLEAAGDHTAAAGRALHPGAHRHARALPLDIR